ncbi:titin-like isoform X2 [Rhopalosiphum maidis]|uniref:titin-like isoform X2 n=1 Tax=Rhopalosiphum maidis TaxID=43146 RepID=UPI000F002DDB|nr:titin-like isoform X2 [Rhopalosiphum maidis]
MWYLKVSSSLLIAVALICMIQNAISLTLDPKTTEDQWSTLENSTDQIDLKKISKMCKNSINNFKEKLENTKSIVNKRLPEPNKTTEDIVNLVSDIKTKIKNSSADLVYVRKLVQKTALRFRDTFKSLVSFTELDNEPVNKELENIKKTTVDGKKPLVNRVIRSFGNRYDLMKLANRVLEISSDHEKLKNNYDEKKKNAKKEFNSLWNSLSNHSKTINDNALKALEIFFEGIKSVKLVKKKAKTLGEDAINEIKVGDDINKLKNAVELAKALKLKFEDEWNLDSGELTYSEEQKKASTKTADENPVEHDNEQDTSIENSSTNVIQSSLPAIEQEAIDNEKNNVIPSTRTEIEKPSNDNSQTSDKAIFSVEDTQFPTEPKNKDETKIIPPTDLEKDDNTNNNVSDNVDSSIKETSFTPDIANNETLITPTKDSLNNKKVKTINKRTSREKTPILPWKKLIELDDSQVSQQSEKCESLLNNTTPDFDNIKKSAKTQIQVTKSYKNLQKIENDIIQQFYDKIVSTNTQLSDNLVNAAEDVCANVTPINKRYETKFKNDPNIKRIKYLLGKQYDPNQYILKVLDDASHKNGIGGMKKTTYYKMLAVAYNLNHETKEMENAALYAMNKIYEGKLAAANLQKTFNKEKASKACYIRNILLEKENEAEKKNKDENKEKIKESISDDTNTEPLKPDVNLDSVDEIQPSTVHDDNEPILNNDEEMKTLNETNESLTLNNQGDTENDTISDEKGNIENEDEEQETEGNYDNSSIPQNKDNDTKTNTTNDGNNTVKHNPIKKVTHHRRHRNPNDPNDVSEEYDTIEEEDENILNKSSEQKSVDTPEAESIANADDENDAENFKNSENTNSDANEQTDEGNASDNPKAKRHRKRFDPKNEEEIPEENETLAEDDKNLNESNAIKSGETPESESTVNADDENDLKNSENSENDNDNANEETDEGKASDKPKVKRRRKRIDPKDGKEIPEENDTLEEKEENNLNKINEIKSDDNPESESFINTDNENEKERVEDRDNKKDTPYEDEGITNDNSNKEPIDDNITNKDLENINKETEELDENEDLNSVEGAELNGVDNENIIPAAESMEENSTSSEISYEEPEQRSLNNYNKQHPGNDNLIKERKNIVDEPNKKNKPHRKRKDPKNGFEVSEEYDTVEEQDEKPLNGDSKKDTTAETPDNTEVEADSETPDHDENENKAQNETDNPEKSNRRRRKRKDPITGVEVSEEYDPDEEQHDEPLIGDNNKETPAETPDNTEVDEDSETPELDENDSNAQNKAVNPKKSNRRRRKRKDPNTGVEDNDQETHVETPDNTEVEADSETPDHDESDNNAQNETDNPEKSNRRRRRRKDPITGVEVSEEYDPDEEQHDEPLIGDNNKETPAETPDNTEVDEDSEAPELDENDSNAQNKAVNPEKSNRRRRKRKDPITGVEVSEEYDTVEEQDDEPLSEDNNKETPGNTEVEADSETPELDENDNNAQNETDNPEKSNRRRRKRKDPITGVEVSEEYDPDEEQHDEPLIGDNKETPAETPDNTEVEADSETPDHDENDNKAQNETDNPEKSNRRRRKRKDPITGVEVSEEYDPDEEQHDEPLIGDNNKETPAETPDNTEVDEDSETPELDENDSNAQNKAVNPKKSNRRHRKRKDPNTGVEDNDQETHVETPDNTEVEADSETPDHDDSDNNAQNETDNPEKSNRRRRRRKDPITGVEVSEEYDPDEEQHDEPLIGDNNKETPAETPDNTEVDEDSEAPELDENDSNAQNKAVNPEKSNRRRRKRKDPITGVEVSEEYDPDEEQHDEPLIGDNKETPAETPDNTEVEADSETPDHDENDNKAQNETDNPEKSNRRRRKRKDPITGVEVSEEYDTVEEQDDEPLSEDNNKETPDNTEVEADSETPELDENDNNAQNETDNPEKSNRRRRKRKDPITGVEVSEEYDAVEEQDDEPLSEDNNKETPAETSDNTEVDEDSETPEFDENDSNAQNKAVNPEKSNRRRRKRKDPITGVEENDQETPVETPDNTDVDEDSETPELDESDINAQNETDNPEKSNRRRRKRKDPITGVEVSEEYDTVEEQDDEPLSEDNNKETPAETPDNTEVDEDSETPEFDENDSNAQNNAVNPEKSNRHRRKRKDPINGVEENDQETPVDTPDNTEVDEDSETPEFDESDVNAQNETDNPEKSNRRRRKRKDPITGVEVSEEYDAVEEQDDEPLSEDNNKETPAETPDNTEVDEDSETPEFDENDSNAQNKAVNPEKSNRRRRKRKDPITGVEENDQETPVETPDNTDVDEDSETPELDESDINAQNETDNPEKSNRRRRKRKDPITGVEENDQETPVETPDNTDVDEDSETPELDESDINAQNETDNPEKSNRRRRKRKDPITGVEVSEEYDTVEEQDDEPLSEDNNKETPVETPDNTEVDEDSETPEFDENDSNAQNNAVNPEKSNRRRRKRKDPINGVEENDQETPVETTDNTEVDVDSETPEFDESDVNAQNETDNPEKSNRRRRKRKDPITGVEVSEEYDTVEEQDDERLIEDNNKDTPAETPDNTEVDEDSETPEFDENDSNAQNNAVNPEKSNRRRRKRKDPINGVEENDQETPVETPDNTEVDEDSETPEFDESDVNAQNETDNPEKSNRRRRKRKDPITGVEENDQETPVETPDNTEVDEDSETPEFDESDVNAQNETDNPEKSNRRRRKRKDPINGVEENDQETPVETPDNTEVVDDVKEAPYDTDEYGYLEKPIPSKLRRRRKSIQPQFVDETNNEPASLVNDHNNNYPVDDQDNESISYNYNDVSEEVPDTEYGKTNDVENNKEQPELIQYPENSDVPSEDHASTNYMDENGNFVHPLPRKLRRRRKLRQPQFVNESNNEPASFVNNNANNYPIDDQDNESIPDNYNDVGEEVPDTGYVERNDIENKKEQPELFEYPDNSYVPSEDYASPNGMYENGNAAQPSPRKLRRRKKLRQPQFVNESNNEPASFVNNNANNYLIDDQDNESIPDNYNDVGEEVPDTGYVERNDIENKKEQPELFEYPDNSYVPSEDYASPNGMYENGNTAQPSPRKLRRRKKSRQPQFVNENNKEPESFVDDNMNNYPVENQDYNEPIPKNESDAQEDVSIPYKTEVDSPDSNTDSTSNSKKPRRKNHVRRKITPTSIDTGNSSTPNDEKSTENPETQPKDIRKNPKKKRHIRRIRTYVINNETNERIPINDETYSTTNGLPDALHNKLDSLEAEDDLDSNTDNDDYSSFLFKEYNSDQCKRNAYDRFKKVASQDAKQIAYRSVLDTSEMRSNMLATIKNAIGNVKASQTFNDVDQSLRTVSYSLKAGLKQTISDLVIKMVPLAKDFLKTAENLKELYEKGPQSTHKMLTNILENESIVPDSAKDILTLISPQFDVDKLINDIFEKPCNAKSMKEKKTKAQRKLITLSKHMDTAISNIDCFVLSAMSTVGIGADTLKLLKSGRVIMSDKHPRAKILKDAVGIIKSGKKIRNNVVDFTPTLTTFDGNTESDEDDDDEDPEQVAQKNEEFLKTVPDLDDNIPVPKKVPNKRQSLGVIVVHPNKRIEYKEINDTSQLKKFVGDQTNKYKLQSKNKHPKFLKLNSKKVIDAMVADVKKKAERNGMTKKEMVEEIIRTLNSS